MAAVIGRQPRGQPRASLRDSLRGSLWDSLRDSLRDSLGDTLWDTLRDSLWDSLGGSLWDSLGDSLGDTLRDSLRDTLRDSLWGNRYFWGQHEWWVAFYDAPRRLGLVTYKPADDEALSWWSQISASCGWWWPHDGLCIISERPAEVHTETWDASQGTVRLHCADGPAMRFHDGWALWTWHGRQIPAWVIEDSFDAQRILSEPNAEIRRCAIERHGWDQLAARLSLVAEAPDPGNPGQVIGLYDLPESLADMYGEPARLALVTNGTPERDGSRRRYGLPVPAHHTDPVAAMAELYDMPAAAYAGLETRR